MLTTNDIPLARDLLDISTAFPVDGRERKILGDAAQVLTSTLDALTRATSHAETHNDYDWLGAAYAALADGQRDWGAEV